MKIFGGERGLTNPQFQNAKGSGVSPDSHRPLDPTFLTPSNLLYPRTAPDHDPILIRLLRGCHKTKPLVHNPLCCRWSGGNVNENCGKSSIWCIISFSPFWSMISSTGGEGGHSNTSVVVHMHDQRFSKHTKGEICIFEENTPKQECRAVLHPTLPPNKIFFFKHILYNSLKNDP